MKVNLELEISTKMVNALGHRIGQKLSKKDVEDMLEGFLTGDLEMVMSDYLQYQKEKKGKFYKNNY